MAITYHVDKAKKNKNLVGDEITLTKVKKTTGGAPDWFIAFEKKLNKRLDEDFGKVNNRIDNLENRLTTVVKVNKLKEK